MPRTFRGKAQVSGCAMTIDVIIYPVRQTAKLSQDFEEEIIKNDIGDDAAWRAWNEKYMGDLECALLGDTAANAAIGAAFQAPLAIVTITGCAVTAWNTTHQVISGGSVDLANDKTGRSSFKLRRYADATQNTLAATIPT